MPMSLEPGFRQSPSCTGQGYGGEGSSGWHPPTHSEESVCLVALDFQIHLDTLCLILLHKEEPAVPSRSLAGWMRYWTLSLAAGVSPSSLMSEHHSLPAGEQSEIAGPSQLHLRSSRDVLGCPSHLQLWQLQASPGTLSAPVHTQRPHSASGRRPPGAAVGQDHSGPGG